RSTATLEGDLRAAERGHEAEPNEDAEHDRVGERTGTEVDSQQREHPGVHERDHDADGELSRAGTADRRRPNEARQSIAKARESVVEDPDDDRRDGGDDDDSELVDPEVDGHVTSSASPGAPRVPRASPWTSPGR